MAAHSSTNLAWPDLEAAVPALADLLDRARSYHLSDDPEFCGAVTWTREIKPRLRGLLGWDSGWQGPLGTDEAFDAAAAVLLAALPPCRACGCL